MVAQTRIELLGGLIKRVSNFRMDSFEGRLIFQKTTYFLQVFGFQLDYPYSWYIYGPYSPILTKDGFLLQREFGRIPEFYFANQESEKRLKQFPIFLGKKKADAEWLETISSIHFLRTLYPGWDKGSVLREVLIRKPKYIRSLHQLEAGWNSLQTHKLV